MDTNIHKILQFHTVKCSFTNRLSHYILIGNNFNIIFVDAIKPVKLLVGLEAPVPSTAKATALVSVIGWLLALALAVFVTKAFSK